jgi:hypothetical protein
MGNTSMMNRLGVTGGVLMATTFLGGADTPDAQQLHAEEVPKRVDYSKDPVIKELMKLPREKLLAMMNDNAYLNRVGSQVALLERGRADIKELHVMPEDLPYLREELRKLEAIRNPDLRLETEEIRWRTGQLVCDLEKELRSLSQYGSKYREPEKPFLQEMTSATFLADLARGTGQRISDEYVNDENLSQTVTIEDEQENMLLWERLRKAKLKNGNMLLPSTSTNGYLRIVSRDPKESAPYAAAHDGALYANLIHMTEKDHEEKTRAMLQFVNEPHSYLKNWKVVGMESVTSTGRVGVTDFDGVSLGTEGDSNDHTFINIVNAVEKGETVKITLHVEATVEPNALKEIDVTETGYEMKEDGRALEYIHTVTSENDPEFHTVYAKVTCAPDDQVQDENFLLSYRFGCVLIDEEDKLIKLTGTGTGGEVNSWSFRGKPPKRVQFCMPSRVPVQQSATLTFDPFEMRFVEK